MAERPIPSGMGEKERVGQQTLSAAQLDAAADRELETVRHHGSPRSVGICGTECAMLGPIGPPHSLEPLSRPAVVHFSGAEIDTRPLMFDDTQFTDENDEKSSATGLSTNEPRRPLNNESPPVSGPPELTGSVTLSSIQSSKGRCQVVNQYPEKGHGHNSPRKDTRKLEKSFYLDEDRRDSTSRFPHINDSTDTTPVPVSTRLRVRSSGHGVDCRTGVDFLHSGSFTTDTHRQTSVVPMVQ
jgi:hypothetical protein